MHWNSAQFVTKKVTNENNIIVHTINFLSNFDEKEKSSGMVAHALVSVEVWELPRAHLAAVVGAVLAHNKGTRVVPRIRPAVENH